MNWIPLIFRNLWFYRKQYCAVMAGVMISTAVLTGALIVGDSVQFSLQQLTDFRLGKIRYALQSDQRFFRQDLANELASHTNIPVAPALQVGGIAVNSDKNLRLNQVQVMGIDNRFGQFRAQPLREPHGDEAIISRNTAEKLDLQLGDEFLLRIQKLGKASPDAPFVSEKAPSVSIRVKVSTIAEDNQLGRFSLKSNQTAPYNIFLSLERLASLLELSGYANLLLIAGNEMPGLEIAVLDNALEMCWKPADVGMHIVHLGDPDRVEDRKYQIKTDRIFFDESNADAILSTIPACESMLTYLVNSISFNKNSTPYSFVTAANEPFLKQPIGKSDIIINDWLAKDLGAKPGDSVMLRYFMMGPLRSLHEDSSWFRVQSIITLNNGLSDPALMPDFPGMSDAGNCRDWETGAPVDLKKIRDKDEQYWNDYRGTPKAFISLADGQQIWGNRFGNYTAFLFEARDTDIPGIEKSLMAKIKPAQCGMSFRPVYEEGQLAARNSTDFGELFLSLSFFILVSALLLTAMLFSLAARRRMPETGIMAAIGFRKRHIMGILSGEVFLIAIAGAIFGTFAGILYNYFLILGLNTIWQDAVNTSLLVMRTKPATLLTGAGSGVIIAMTVLLYVLWKNLRKPLSVLVRSDSGIQDLGSGRAKYIPNLIVAILSIGISLAIILWILIRGGGVNGSLSLMAGGFMLAGGLAWLNLFLLRSSKTTGMGIPGFFQFTLKNLALHRSRMISAVALLSLGTFTIIITGANSKTFYGKEITRQSGTGGFLLWAESSLPVMNDLNLKSGAGIFGLEDEEVLKMVRFVQLRRLDGDDASCLNLNQVSRPALLGVPSALFNARKSFSVINANPSVDKKQPWKSLDSRLAPDMIAGFADQTVITWGLRKSIGDTLFYLDESGEILKIKLMGGLDNSIFQGNILVSDSLLGLFYPSLGGSRIMLIDGPENQRDTISDRLETLFRDYGLMVTPATARLASFNMVENTYLSVFMLLGGLGVIIGTVGLGIVLIRNIAQRHQELALYVALGFRKQYVFNLILAEHLLILISGLFLGLIAAFPVILPLIISPGYHAPVVVIAGILLMILANGFLWIYFPAKKLISRDPLSGLRAE